MLGIQRLMCTSRNYYMIIILNPELFSEGFQKKITWRRMSWSCGEGISYRRWSCFTVCLSVCWVSHFLKKYNSRHAMSEPNDAKSIAWTRFSFELDTFKEFATAVFRIGSRILFRRGCTTKEFLLLYFKTNKPHFCFLQNTSCIRKPRVISGGGGGGWGAHSCTLPLDPPLCAANCGQEMIVIMWST